MSAADPDDRPDEMVAEVDDLIAEAAADDLNGWRRIPPADWNLDVHRDRRKTPLVQWANDDATMFVTLFVDEPSPTDDREEPQFNSWLAATDDIAGVPRTSIARFGEILETALDSTINFLRTHTPNVALPEFSMRIEGGILLPLVDALRRFADKGLIEVRADELVIRGHAFGGNFVEITIPKSDAVDGKWAVGRQGEMAVAPNDLWEQVRDFNFSDEIPVRLGERDGRPAVFVGEGSRFAEHPVTFARRSPPSVFPFDAQFAVTGQEFDRVVAGVEGVIDPDTTKDPDMIPLGETVAFGVMEGAPLIVVAGEGTIEGRLAGATDNEPEPQRERFAARFDAQNVQGSGVVAVNIGALRNLRIAVPRPSSTTITTTVKEDVPLLFEYQVNGAGADLRVGVEDAEALDEFDLTPPPTEIEVPEEPEAKEDDAIPPDVRQETRVDPPYPVSEIRENARALDLPVAFSDVEGLGAARIEALSDVGLRDMVDVALVTVVGQAPREVQDALDTLPGDVRRRVLNIAHNIHEDAILAAGADGEIARTRDAPPGDFSFTIPTGLRNPSRRIRSELKNRNVVNTGDIERIEDDGQELVIVRNPVTQDDTEADDVVEEAAAELAAEAAAEPDEPEQEPEPPEPEKPDEETRPIRVGLAQGRLNYEVPSSPPEVEAGAISAALEVLGQPDQFEDGDQVGEVTIRGTEILDLSFDAGMALLEERAAEEQEREPEPEGEPEPALTAEAVQDEFPEVDDDEAAALARAFDSVAALLDATPVDLLALDGVFGTTVTRMVDGDTFEPNTPIGEQRPKPEPMPEPEPEPEPEPIPKDEPTLEDEPAEQLRDTQIETIVEQATLGVDVTTLMIGNVLQEIRMSPRPGATVELDTDAEVITTTRVDGVEATINDTIDKWETFVVPDTVSEDERAEVNRKREALSEQFPVTIPQFAPPMPDQPALDRIGEPARAGGFTEAELEEMILRATEGTAVTVTIQEDINNIRIEFNTDTGTPTQFVEAIPTLSGVSDAPIDLVNEAIAEWETAVDLRTVDIEGLVDRRARVEEEFGVALLEVGEPPPEREELAETVSEVTEGVPEDVLDNIIERWQAMQREEIAETKGIATDDVPEFDIPIEFDDERRAIAEQLAAQEVEAKKEMLPEEMAGQVDMEEEGLTTIENGLQVHHTEAVHDQVHAVIARQLDAEPENFYDSSKPSDKPGYDLVYSFYLRRDSPDDPFTNPRFVPSQLLANLEPIDGAEILIETVGFPLA